MAVDIKLLAKWLYPAASQFILPQTVVPQCFRHSSDNLIQTKSYNIDSIYLLSRFLLQKPTYVCKRNLVHPKNCLSLIKNNSSSLTLVHPLNSYRPPRNLIQQKICLSLLEENNDFPVTLFRPSNPDRLLSSHNELKSLLLKSNSSFLTLFRPLNPNGCLKSLLQDTNSIKHLQGHPKTFFFRRRNNNEDGKKPQKRIPKLILIQNPITWFMTKIDFTILRSNWDPAFKEREFKYGTQQAIAKVTNVISDGHFTELNGLLTKAARLSLMRELDRNWSEKQRSLLALSRNDIQITSPRKVYFIRLADKKYCDVDMAFLALKWAPINSIEALIFTEIFARFHREYTPHSIPEWTIAYFKVTRFEVLRRKPKT